MHNEITWAEIDLDAIAHNARQLKKYVGERTELMAVVKANAYGHGAVPAARAALEGGASRLAVARVDEGLQLRSGGIAAPILVMGYAIPPQAGDIVRHRLTPTVNTLELAQALSAEVAQQKAAPLPVHLKVDTGLGRFGLLPGEVLDFARALVSLPGLFLEGFWTHFACADEADKSYTYQQFALYCQVARQLEEAGIAIPIKHVANSAATLSLPEMHLDMVRCGITIYGLRPSEEVKMVVPVRPAMTIKSHVARVRTLPAGSGISYNRTYVTARPTPVALVPIGYGDGYRRGLSNKGAVLIHGQRVPIIGRVCMDQFMVDVSAIPDVQQNDEVVVLGRQGEEEINAEEIGALVGTNNYETVAALLPRVPRVYLREGQVVGRQTIVQTSYG
ncbi:MAG: alanine racemase [Chloroflexi bacterium]|nr:alanine racemase [Chloroflexota bacterium]